MSIKIPTKLEDLTPQWLTDALQKNYPGAGVKALHFGTVIHGTATKVRLLLDYNDEGHRLGLPPTMWFKGGLEDHSLSPDMLIVYASEAAFFENMASTLGARVPQWYAARIDPRTNHSFVLLEDLLARNATFGHASRPVSPAEITGLLDELAKLHSRYWKSDTIGDYPWLKAGGSLLQSCDIMMSEATWDRSMCLPRGRFVTGPLRDFTVMRSSVLNILRTDSEQAVCMVHGDSHIGNTYRLRGGEWGLLDWQSSFYGVWAHDVTYLLITALTIEDRRTHERDLLRHYMSRMQEHGIAIGWDSAWRDYRRHTFYACSWSMCLPEWQAEETCCLVTERAIAAAIDLDSLSA